MAAPPLPNLKTEGCIEQNTSEQETSTQKDEGTKEKDKRKVGMEEQAPQGYRRQRKQCVCQDIQRQEILLVPPP